MVCPLFLQKYIYPLLGGNIYGEICNFREFLEAGSFVLNVMVLNRFLPSNSENTIPENNK